MKKIITLLLSFIMLFSIPFVNILQVSAESYLGYYNGQSGNIHYSFNGQTGVLNISGYNMLDYNFNSESTCPPWYTYRSRIKKLVINNGVTNIGDFAFAGLYCLESVSIGSSVCTIGVQSFYNCDKLLNVTIPKSTYSIGEGAFFGNENLKSVLIEGNVKYYGNQAFAGCEKLETFNIPNGTTSLSMEMFRACINLNEVTIPNSVNCIETKAFYYCNNLKTINYHGTRNQWNNISIGSDNNALKNASFQEVHNYEIVDKLLPTCVDKGFVCYICNECNNEYNEIIDYSEHTIVVDDSIAATCMKQGLSEGSHCSVCGEVIVKQNAIPTTEHVPIIDFYIAPTCTATGLTEGSHCSICNATLVEQIVVKATGHTIVTDKAVAPNCTTIGLTEGSHCSACNTVLKSQYTIESLGHNYVSKITNPTCTEQGYTTYTCDRGDNTYNADYENALGHSFTDYKSNNDAVSATCTATGITASQTAKCDRCDETDTKAGTVVKALGHTEVVDKAVAPTCTKAGKESDTICSTCGIKLTTGKTISATGHSYTTKVVKPTYAAKGYTLHTCSVCKASYKDKYTNKLTVAKPSISKVVSPKSKQIKVTWGKKSYTGYQVQIATDSKFTKNTKSATIKKASTVSTTFTKLKGKTKYYVRVRAYKTYNGKNYYSAWSSAKTVTTKK